MFCCRYILIDTDIPVDSRQYTSMCSNIHRPRPQEDWQPFSGQFSNRRSIRCSACHDIRRDERSPGILAVWYSVL